MRGVSAGPLLQQWLLLEVDWRVEPARVPAQPRPGSPRPEPQPSPWPRILFCLTNHDLVAFAVEGRPASISASGPRLSGPATPPPELLARAAAAGDVGGGQGEAPLRALRRPRRPQPRRPLPPPFRRPPARPRAVVSFPSRYSTATLGPSFTQLVRL